MAQLILEIPDNKVDEAKTAFLKAQPKPDGFAGSDVAWIKKVLRAFLLDRILAGKQKIAQEALEDVSTLVTDD